MGNQERQIRLLIDRCDVLQKERDGERWASELAVKELQSQIASLSGQLSLTAEKLSDAQAVNTRMMGWQDCAREIFELRADAMVASLP